MAIRSTESVRRQSIPSPGPGRVARTRPISRSPLGMPGPDAFRTRRGRGRARERKETFADAWAFLGWTAFLQADAGHSAERRFTHFASVIKIRGFADEFF